MAMEDNKTVMCRIVDEVWDKGEPEVIDELFAPDFVDHNPGPYGSGREALKKFVTMFRTAFPDLHTTELDLIAEGDKVAARYTAIGTQEGDFMGVPPTGKQVTMSGVIFAKFANGKVVETWDFFDMIKFMEQLGIAPAMASARISA